MEHTISAHAKINLGLNVNKLRHGESKHRLKSLFILTREYTDIIRIKPSNQLSVKYITTQCDLAINNDSVTRTMHFLAENFNLNTNYAITIDKRIPVKAGLGGSSADSGAIIRYFALKENLNIDAFMMLKIALELGSDIPFFISGHKMALVSGFGQKVKAIKKPIPKFTIHPNDITCDTKQIYDTFDKLSTKQSKNRYWRIINDLPNLAKCNIINHLEIAATQINPQLAQLKAKNYIMTGGGSYFISLTGVNKNEN